MQGGMTIFQHQDLVDELVEEMAVMRDDDDRPVILAHGLLEDFLGGHVKMVGRLIHDQQVGRGNDHLGQGQSAFFAAGKHRHLFIDIIALEKKGGQQGPLLGGRIGRRQRCSRSRGR